MVIAHNIAVIGNANAQCEVVGSFISFRADGGKRTNDRPTEDRNDYGI